MPAPFPKFGLNTEFAPLGTVLLHKPQPQIAGAKDPAAVQHLRKIDAAVMDEEYRNLIQTFRDLNIKVVLINPQPLEGEDLRSAFNLMYTRDLFFMTPQGAVLASMAGDVRKGEVKHARHALERHKIPVLGTVHDPGTFEGADALWLTRTRVIVGTGNRTNAQGLAQLRRILAPLQVTITTVAVPGHLQHLLGILQLVDRDMALVRTAAAQSKVREVLQEEKIEVVEIPEIPEVTERQAMNVVTIAPRKVIMAADCPQTKRIYQKHGIEVAAEIPISQLINGGGGLACATGILSRRT